MDADVAAACASVELRLFLRPGKPEVDLNRPSADDEVSVVREELNLREPKTISVEVGRLLQVSAWKLGNCRTQYD